MKKYLIMIIPFLLFFSCSQGEQPLAQDEAVTYLHEYTSNTVYTNMGQTMTLQGRVDTATAQVTNPDIVTWLSTSWWKINDPVISNNSFVLFKVFDIVESNAYFLNYPDLQVFDGYLLTRHYYTNSNWYSSNVIYVFSLQ